MWKVLSLLVFALVLTALALGTPTPQAHSQEERPWTEALNEQLELPEVQKSEYAVLLAQGVGVRTDEARAMRDLYAGWYREWYGDDLTILALPTYGRARGFAGLIDWTWRSLLKYFGQNPAHLDEALRTTFEERNQERKGGLELLGIVLHSGANLSLDKDWQKMVEVLREFKDQVAPGFTIVCVNGRPSDRAIKGLQDAGVTFKIVERDVVWLLEVPGSSVVPFGQHFPPSTVVGTPLKLGGAVVGALFNPLVGPDHRLDLEEKARLIGDDALGLSDALDAARERDRAESEDQESDEEADEDAEDTATPVSIGPFPPGCPPFCPPFFWGGGGGGGAIAPSTPPAPPPDGTGGVDFSSLDLRYLTEYAEPTASSYVFGAALRGNRTEAGEGIDLERATDLSWNSFFVWLTLPDSTFWVNLNPDEPGRIIDSRLGTTDVGRIMLEADLQMKKDLGRLTHPDTEEGMAFWDALYALKSPESGGQAEGSISVNFRVWIVPGEVTVFEDDSQVYVVDAALDVKLEAEHLQSSSGSQPESSGDSPEALGEAEELLKTMILPKLVEEVNTAPQYRELRQVFYSRVLAQWYKSSAKTTDLAFEALIDQSSMESLQSQESWSAEDIFQRYLQSVSEGEYRVTKETEERHGDYIETQIQTFFHGGVDLVEVPVARVSFDRLIAEDPEVDPRLLDSLLGSGYKNEDEEWFGGLFVVDMAGLEGLPGQEGEDGPQTTEEGTQTGGGATVDEAPADRSGDGTSVPLFVIIGSLAGVGAAVLLGGLWWFFSRPV